MSERRVNVRLQAIGADGVKRELADVGASGKASLSQIGDGAKEAGEGMQRAGDGASRFDRAMRNGTTRAIAQQLNQVAQSGMASGNWLQALAIQIPDIMLSFGALGAVAGAAAGLVLPFVANLITGGDKAEEMKDALKELEKGIKDYQGAVELAISPTDQLGERFGSLAERMRPLLQDMATNKRLDLADDLRNVIEPITEGLEEAAGQLEVVQQGILSEGFDLNQNLLGNVPREFRSITAAIEESMRALEKAPNVNAQLDAAERLRTAYIAAADAVGGRDKGERERIAQLDELVLALAGVIAQDEALAAAATESADAQQRAADAAAAASKTLATGTTAEESAKILADATAAGEAAVATSDSMERLRESAAAAQAELAQAVSDAQTMQDTASAVAAVKESWAEFQSIVGTDLTSMTGPFIAGMAEMTGAAEDAAEAIPAAISRAVQEVAGLSDAARAAGAAIGRNIAEGAAEGIDGQRGRLVERARAMSQAVKDAVTTDLQIQSPSRVMRGYGQNVAEGLALGIDDKSTLAAEAAADMGEQVKTGWAAAVEGLESYAADAMDLGANIGDGIVGAFRSAENALAQFVQTGKMDIKGLVSSIIADFAQIGAKRFIFGPLSNLLGGIMGGIGGGYTGATVMHSGGMVGSGGSMRSVPSSLFAGAQRFHSGGWPGLASDEVPAILQRGERVLSRREVAAGGGGVNVTIQTPDPRSFQSSRAQIAADLARAVGAGRRGI